MVMKIFENRMSVRTRGKMSLTFLSLLYDLWELIRRA